MKRLLVIQRIDHRIQLDVDVRLHLAQLINLLPQDSQIQHPTFVIAAQLHIDLR